MLPTDEDAQRAYLIARQRSQAGLQDYYNTIGQDISQQFAPQFSGARSMLANNPLLADSGYSNRLNRQLMSGAFGQLTSQYGQGANQLESGNIDLLRQLLAERQRSRSGLASQYFGQKAAYAARPKKNAADYLGQAAGTGLGLAFG
jgi:hypothetical protein